MEGYAKLKSKQLTSLQFIVQGIGAIFLGVFLSAYLFSLPANDVLHGELVYRALLGIFGGLFLVLILASFVLSAVIKPED